MNERLSRELRNRASQAGGHPISLDDVKRSANKMKWQQRAATGAVAAVVLAIAVPVGLSVAGNGGTSDGSPPVATRQPTATASQTPSQTPSPTPGQAQKVLLRTDVERGADPQVLYVSDRQLRLPDGTAIPVKRDYTEVVAFGIGWLAHYRDDEGNVFADVLGPRGELLRTFASAFGIAVGSKSQQVAVFEDTTDAGALRLYDADGKPVGDWRFANGVLVHPVGILDDGSVVYITEGVDQVAMVARPGGGTRPLAGAISAGGVAGSRGLVAGMVSVDDLVPESCWNLFDVTGTAQWPKKRCQYSLGRFSPDERLVLGHPSYRDGIGDGLIAILAETGEPLVEYAAPDASFIGGAVWEDDTHVLAMVYGGDGDWHMLRLDTAGNVEDATGPLPGDEMSNPVQFGAAP